MHCFTLHVNFHTGVWEFRFLHCWQFSCAKISGFLSFQPFFFVIFTQFQLQAVFLVFCPSLQLCSTAHARPQTCRKKYRSTFWTKPSSGVKKRKRQSHVKPCLGFFDKKHQIVIRNIVGKPVVTYRLRIVSWSVPPLGFYNRECWPECAFAWN